MRFGRVILDILSGIAWFLSTLSLQHLAFLCKLGHRSAPSIMHISRLVLIVEISPIRYKTQ